MNIVATHPNRDFLRDNEPTLDWNLKSNHHPNKYMEHEKNETQLDTTIVEARFTK